MTFPELQRRLRSALGRAVAARFTGTVSEWAERNLRFNEPKRQGAFSLYTREYIREPLDCYGRDEVTDIVLCWGTRTAKTTLMFAGAAYRAFERARRALYVKPSAKGTAGAENDARTRFIPMLRASACMAALIPSGGQARHNFKTAQQMLLNGSIIDWTGSNSATNLASNSMEDVYQDEVDKFNTTRRRDEEGNPVEADASDLADERTAEYRNPKRVKASTPTLVTGRIWAELLKTDLRRRFVPCPLCGRDHPSSRRVLLAWSKNYTVLPKVWGAGTSYEPNTPLPLAYVRWDDEARRADGTWDLERVERSAGYVCPHCGGRFRDEAKTWMDLNGAWIPTQRGAPRMAGFHLPSMYSSHEELTVGKMASGFLKAVHSIKGPQNFINSKLAEPNAGQDLAAARVETVSRVELLAEWKRTMQVDCQQKAPFFWFLVYAFGGREIVAVKGGPLEVWDEVRQMQLDNQVMDAAVVVDSGFGAKDDAEVYRTCAQYGEIVRNPATRKLMHIGWLPAKGMPGHFKRLDKKSGLYVPWYYRPIDPFMGTADAGKVSSSLFEFARDEFNTQLERLRHNRSTDFRYTIAPDLDTDEFHLHMRGHVQREKNGKMVWERRHRYAPDHLRSCAIMGIAAANALGLLDTQKLAQKSTEANGGGGEKAMADGKEQMAEVTK